MALLLAFIASICASTGNFLVRQVIENKGSTIGYLLIYLLFSLIASILSNLTQFSFSNFSPAMFGFGAATGILSIVMMLLLLQALQTGPTGLSQAFLNSGAVLPIFLLALLFGHDYGFDLTSGRVIGVFVVAGGIFWGFYRKDDSPLSAGWGFYALATFFLQGLILAIFQWRCLLYTPDVMAHPLLPMRCTPEEEIWFTPGMFVSATLIQFAIFIKNEARSIKWLEWRNGAFAGVLNGISTYLLLWAAQAATGYEKAMLFPFFAIAVITSTNMWARVLYGERVNWLANALCCTGILLGSAF